MHRLPFVSCFMLLLSVLASARGEEELLRVPLTESGISAPRVTWYGIYLDGAKIGYLREEFARSGEGEGAFWFLDQTGTMQMKSMGQETKMDISERQEFDAAPPFAFRGGYSRMKQNDGGAEEIEVTRDASGLSARVTAGGETRTLPVPAIDFTLADQLTPERWIQTSPEPGAHGKVRAFSMNDLDTHDDTLTVLTRKESLVQGVRTLFFEVRQVRETSGEEGIARLDAQGQIISIVFGGLFEGRVETEEDAKRIEAVSDIFVFGMAPIDQPIGDPRKVKRLVLEVEGEGADDLREGPAQSIALHADRGSATLTLGAGAGVEETVTAEETEEALKETVDYPCSLPQVKALSAEAVGEAATPREKVARLVHFVSEYVEDELVPGSISVPEVIASKQGDCTEHAALFTTLARASGIPAREVSGLMYMGDDILSFGGHAWGEVLLDGRWVAVDPTWDQTEIDATHVTLDREGREEGSLGALGRLKFRLVSQEVEK